MVNEEMVKDEIGLVRFCPLSMVLYRLPACGSYRK